MCISDWSSDVCSSDLVALVHWRQELAAEPGVRPGGGRKDERRDDERRLGPFHHPVERRAIGAGQAPGDGIGLLRRNLLPDKPAQDRKSVGWGKSVAVSVELGGRRNIKKKTQENMKRE